MRITFSAAAALAVLLTLQSTLSAQTTEPRERVLVPIFTPPVQGAFGSQFQTLVRASNRSDSQPLVYYGVDTACYLFSPVLGPEDPRTIPAGGDVVEVLPGCSHWPARFLYVPQSMAGDFEVNLRVRDTSRADLSAGTEIPVVRENEFKNRIVLVGLPHEPRFRSSLRIYGLPGATPAVTVKIAERTYQVTLQPGHDQYEPSYATFNDFSAVSQVPEGLRDFTRATVDSPSSPVWAFISVTNNETQEITTITPD